MANAEALRERLGRLALPLVCAPMFLVSGLDLVRAACRAGVIGALPSANARDQGQFALWMDELARDLEERSDKTGPQGILAANLNVRAGERMDTPRFEADMATCRRHEVQILITVNGDPRPVVEQAHDWGGHVFHDVTTLKHARKAALSGVDGLVLVCGGGGGHSGAMNPFSFVPQVREFFDGIIVLAGAIGSGQAVWAAEALGADLCYMGTRFIATQESMAPPDYKAMIRDAASSDLLYTGAFSRGGVPAMLLRESIRAQGFDPEALPASDVFQASGVRMWKDLWAAGQSVGVINDIPPVAKLVARLTAEYASARSRVF